MADDLNPDDTSKDGRWKKGGPSPNPHGRRGKSRSAESAPTRALDQELSVKQPGGKKTKKTTVRERMALQLAKEALEGDKKALKMLLDWEKAARDERKAVEAAPGNYAYDEGDLKTIRAMCDRIRALKPEAPST